MSYKQGDIVWVNFPFTDISQLKPRPALVLSNEVVNSSGDYLLVQVTSKLRNDGFSIIIDNIHYAEPPLELKSYLRFHKLFLLKKALILGKKTSVTEIFRKEVVEKIVEIIK